MVLVHPNPPPGQGFNHFYSCHFGGDPTGMKTTEKISQMPSYWSAGADGEDPSKKVRKPYTITKSRESWSEQEHEKFIEALHLFDRDWKKIEAFVGSKTVIQIRSHAQKYFMKVQKNGTCEHVPPPRPKRKAAHPYPQKAPIKAALLDSKYVLGPQSMSLPGNITSSVPIYSWAYSGAPTGCAFTLSNDDSALSGGTMMHNWSCNSFKIAHCPWTSSQTNGHVNENRKEMRAVPDFAQVYSFIGSLFDPRARDHLERLKKMDPINVETVLTLVNNLSVNLLSAEFKKHFSKRSLMSSDNGDMCSETSA